MRKDMHKVLIERPRGGSWLPSPKTRLRWSGYDPGKEYDYPKRGSTSWNRIVDRKHFSDLLGPLFRYLDKQVGRPWWKIEGEIRKTMDIASVTGRHLWNHIINHVTVHCWVDEKGGPHGFRWCGRVEDLYVHPRTGLLRRRRPERRDRAGERRNRIEQADYVRLNRKA